MFRLRSQLPQRFVRTAAGAGSNGQVVRTQKREFLSLLESKWFSSPKGFGRFTRNRSAKEGESNSSSSTSGTSSNSSSNATKGEKPKFSSNSGNNGSGGSGGKKPKKEGNDFNSSIVSSIVILGGLSFVSMFIGGNTNGREISWQDFQKQLMETGMVDRIIVTNKKVARVVLRAKAYEGETSIHDQVSSGALNNAAPTGNLDSSSTSTGTSGAYTWQTETFPAADANATGAAGAAKPDFTRYPSIGNHGRSVTPFYFNIGTVESFERKLEDAQKQLGISSRDYIPVIYIDETDWIEEFTRFLPTLILMGGMMFLARRAMSGGRGDGPGGIFRFGKSPAKRVQKEQVSTTFANVAGCDEAKREIMEFVQFLKDPKKFTDLGAKIPKGALLCGPPGTGKTLLAKATAGEADVPFYTISGSDFVEMFVGVGPSRVRDLFEEARNNAPCIIFIDEIDAVGRQRGKGGFSGGNDERENTLNQLLVEMDGFDKSTNIVVLAGTNRVDILDAALTRPGRFDRQITVDRPDIKGRKQIFEIYLKNIALDGKVEDFSGRLAALTPGFVGADIANICNEAAIIAARRNKKGVQLEDFESATDRVIGGLESRKIMSPEEKKVVAYHEAGHAIAGWFLEHADPLLKVTIVPRGNGALGFAQYLPKELFLRTRDQILDMVCMALAGRASEEVNFGRVTTGAADDLRRVTQIVYNMVTVYGMNERVGQVAFPKEEGGFPGDRLYSDATAQVMDEEVRQIVAEAYSRTLNLIRARQQDVVKVAELLLSKETITNMDVAELIGRRPFETSKEYDEYLNYGRKPENQEETASEPAATEDATATPETAEQPPADKDPKAV